MSASVAFGTLVPVRCRKSWCFISREHIPTQADHSVFKVLCLLTKLILPKKTGPFPYVQNDGKRQDFPDERWIVDAHKAVYFGTIKGFEGGG